VIGVIALGVIVVLAGLAVLVVEAHVSTAGVLGLAGMMAVAAGIGLIIASSGAGLLLAVPVSIVLAITGAVATAIMARKILVARREALRTGPSSLIGTTATVRTWSGDEGQVATDGTLWRARMSYGWEHPLPVPGQMVIVAELDGLTLSVRRPHAWEVVPVWVPSSLSL
jgi:membrane-bound ClpP family serine protease